MSYLGSFSLSPEQRSAYQTTLDEWVREDKVRRLWDRDASLWTNTTEAQWLGWLGIVEAQVHDNGRFAAIAAEVSRREYSDIVLLGMGGSSLCPEVLALSFGRMKGFPALHILDSTDPAQVRSIEKRVNLATTLFIVSSKSGSTLEPNIFKQYFFERAGRDGSRFIAITDPGSKMEQVAREDKFAHIFYGLPSIGGRYSALSDFGMIPAAAMGINTSRFLEKAKAMADACSPWQAPDQNPGLQLGVFLGTLANAGRNKLTIVCSPGIHDLGAWMEQLIAESTGKEGKGIIPVDREPLAAPGNYGKDRVFAYLRLEGAADRAQDSSIAALEAAGFPVVRITVADAYQLGAEFFRWEFATAIAGAILGINPFDQPDVEFSKIETKKLTTAFEETGKLPDEIVLFEFKGIKVYGFTSERSISSCLRSLLSDISPTGYVAVLAYVEMTPHNEAVLNSVREHIRDRTKAATCLGFGPRFLHSTGQAYKGGPAGGVFIQITADDAEDVPVPGQKYTFGIVKAAQAQGDLAVLKERGRRWLRIHLGKDVRAGLAEVASAVTRALQ
ncbi:MAG: bifunctional transaldolase/phosoglucose isomerase [Bryobacteraceae bacterium]